MTRAATARTGVLAVALVVALGVLAWALRTGSPSSTFDAAAAPEPAEATATPPDIRIVETIASGLTSPWGLAFLPDGSALVSERDTGQIARIPAGGGAPVPLGTVDGSVPSGEGGLLGLAVPPGAEPSFVLAYTTTAQDNRIVRIEWDGERLGQQTPILTGIPRNTYHDGGRLLALADGTFVVGTGDAGTPNLAQDPTSLAGKVLRITAEGAPAPGNPDAASPVLTLGHRNVQGLALDSEGRLWASEFGQNDADELNLIRPGANYGWPVHEGAAGDARYADPAVQWSPTSTASPSGVAILDDVAYVASLRGEVLWQVPLVEERAAAPVPLELGDLGRLRTVAAAPDGSLWLVTSNTDGRGSPRTRDDRILRLAVG
jgi:glucose/arabinose dehydrogenase